MAASELARPLVLVAEDEPTVNRLLVRVLTEEGYPVLAARDGQAALELLRSLPRPVDLLVADIRMPLMTGDTLAFRALGEGLASRVLFITGYGTHPESPQMLGPVLLKPFSPDGFLDAVASVLPGRKIRRPDAEGGSPHGAFRSPMPQAPVHRV